MSRYLFTTPRSFQTRLVLAIALVGCLVWLGLTFFRRPAPAANHAVGGASASPGDITNETKPDKLEGAQARRYLEQTSEGQSLTRAITVARFGLKREKESPFDRESGAGYLGMSHDQNLNA